MELVTPTGALLITGYARAFGPLPPMRIDRVGYGAGDRDPKETPNVLRVMHGERAAQTADDTVVQIECEIDDMNPQLFGPLMDRLGEAGALDVFYAAVQMKKNRPGTLVTVVAPPEKREALTGVIFTHTTTIGVRYQELRRDTLDRKIVSIDTPLGPLRIKVAGRDGRVLNAAAEFDDCAKGRRDVARPRSKKCRRSRCAHGSRRASGRVSSEHVSFLSNDRYRLCEQPPASRDGVREDRRGCDRPLQAAVRHRYPFRHGER